MTKIELPVHVLCACGAEDCLHPKCENPGCGCCLEDMAGVDGEPSILACLCGRLHRLELCSVGEALAEARETGRIDCPSCTGTGIGYPPGMASCGRCRGSGTVAVDVPPAPRPEEYAERVRDAIRDFCAKRSR